MTIRGEVLDGPERRRRWSEDEKAAVLADFAKPGSRGAEVARRHGVSTGLMYTWRKEHRAAARVAAVEMSFAPVLLTGPAAAATAPSPQLIEIETKGVRVRLPVGVAPATVAATIKALRGRS